MMRRENKDRLIAGGITMFVMFILLLLLYFGNVGDNRKYMAASSIPETGSDEELFVLPDYEEPVQDLPEQNIETKGEMRADYDKISPADKFSGEPDKADKENPVRVEPGRSPKVSPPQPMLSNQENPSPVKTTEPTQTEKEKQRATSLVANAFSGRNGAQKGRSDGTGASRGKGTGINVNGDINGRKFLGCQKFNPELEHRVTVKIRVTVNADGMVKSVELAGGDAPMAVKQQCLAAAKTARWESQPGAADQRGVLTFVLTPR